MDGRRFAIKRVPPEAVMGDPLERYRAIVERLSAAGISAPACVAGLRARDGATLLVMEHRSGTAGSDVIGSTAGERVAASMGSVIRRFRDVDVMELPVDRSWCHGVILRQRARGWLAIADDWVDPGTMRAISAHIETLPSLMQDRAASFAHGDFCPVNVLVDARGKVVAIVDLDTSRVADELLDVAWWGATVWHHHRSDFGRLWPPILVAAGVTLDPPTVRRLRALAVTRTLEALASVVSVDRDAVAFWASRISSSLDFLR